MEKDKNVCHNRGIGKGWDDPISWIQINTLMGQKLIQKVPTESDDVLLSYAMSVIASVTFETDDANPDFNIGGSDPYGPCRCRCLHISNTEISFDNHTFIDAAPPVNVYTSNGGFVIIDSGSNMLHGHFKIAWRQSCYSDLQILKKYVWHFIFAC